MKKLLSIFVLLTAILAVACQGSGESSVGPLQAVKYIPQQGDAVVTYKDNTEESRMTLAFEISPKEYITTLVKVWQQTVSCAVQCDNQTIQLEIQSLRSSVEMGKISMTISCGALPETFFAEQSAATAMVHIADGDNVISSESIALSVKREVKPEQIVFQKYAKENELKVMSFNVRVGSNWTSRQEACVALIIDQQPCVIGFQEAAYSAQWLYLKEQLKDNYDGWGVNRDTGKESGSGEVMGILYNKSKLEKIEGGTFWLSPTPNKCSYGWDAAYRRTATWGVFKHKATQTIFLYINTHLDNEGSEARIRSLEQIANFCGKYPAYPAILGGDMNIESYNEAFKPINAIMHNTRDAAPREYTDYLGTYNGYSASSSILDHIYCSKTIKVLEYHTIRENYGVAYVSDHYPIYSILLL